MNLTPNLIFINALREVLGLVPMPFASKPRNRETGVPVHPEQVHAECCGKHEGCL